MRVHDTICSHRIWNCAPLLSLLAMLTHVHLAQFTILVNRQMSEITWQADVGAVLCTGAGCIAGGEAWQHSGDGDGLFEESAAGVAYLGSF